MEGTVKDVVFPMNMWGHYQEKIKTLLLSTNNDHTVAETLVEVKSN